MITKTLLRLTYDMTTMKYTETIHANSLLHAIRLVEDGTLPIVSTPPIQAQHGISSS